MMICVVDLILGNGDRNEKQMCLIGTCPLPIMMHRIAPRRSYLVQWGYYSGLIHDLSMFYRRGVQETGTTRTGVWRLGCAGTLLAANPR